MRTMVLAVLLATSATTVLAQKGRPVGTLTGNTLGNNQAFSVTLDSQGNAIAAGVTTNTDSYYDFTVAKWDHNNNLVWSRTLNGPGYSWDVGYSVKTDSQDNVVAAGAMTSDANHRDFAVGKWDAAGNLLWSRMLPDGTAYAIGVDDQDNVIAAGYTLASNGNSTDVMVAKWDAAGNSLWTRTLSESDIFYETAYALAIDVQGNVAIAGNRFTVAKWDPAGTLLWSRTIEGTLTANGNANAIAADSQGNIVAAGYLFNTNTYADFAVAKWDPDGNLLWSRTIAGAAANQDVARAVAVDQFDNVLAAGSTYDINIGKQFTVAKWDALGNSLWTSTLTGGYGEAKSVAAEMGGGMIVGGYNNGAFTVAKWNSAGHQEWTRTVSSDPSGFGTAWSVAVRRGQAVAVGDTYTPFVNQYLTVVRLQ